MAKINKACVLNMLQKHEEALSYLNSDSFNENEKKDPNYLLIRGTTLALNKQHLQANQLFNELKSCGNEVISGQALHNLHLIQHQGELNSKSNKLTIPEKAIKSLESLTLQNTEQWTSISLSETENLVFKINKTQPYNSYLITDEFNNYFSLLKLKNDPDNSTQSIKHIIAEPNNHYDNFVYSDKFYFVKSETKKIILKCDLEGNILEMAKYDTF
ncbi:MAG: hypothetical protein AAFZ15_22365 [Bacteroidota bacterium]